jgi:hypothetical protein
LRGSDQRRKKRFFFEKKKQKTFAPGAASTVPDSARRPSLVMAGLDPAIHASLFKCNKTVSALY